MADRVPLSNSSATAEDSSASSTHHLDNAAASSIQSDLENLFRCTQIPTLFLDDDLLIRSFTPAITEIYSLYPADISRPLDQFAAHVDNMPPLPALEELQPGRAVEDELVAHSGKAFIRRVLRYQAHTGELSGIVITFVDISDLHDREELFQLLVEASSQIVWMADAQGAVTQDSPSWRAFTGQSFEQWIGNGWINAVHPDDRQATMSTWMGVVQDGRPLTMEYRLWHHSGVWKWVRVKGVAQRLPNGTVKRWVGMISDITERKEWEMDLAAREANLRSVIDNMLGFVGVLDSNGIVREVNRTALLASGLQREDVIGLPFWECYWWSHDAEVSCQMKRGVERALQGEVVRYDVEARVHDGGRMSVDFMLVPLKNQDGRITHLIQSGVDISDRKRAEREAREREQFLQVALEAGEMGTFLWNVPENRVEWSEQMYAIFGCTREQFDGRLPSLDDMIHPDDRLMMWQRLQEELDSGTDEHWNEFRAIRPNDGCTVWIQGRGLIERDSAGNALRVTGVVHDITAFKTQELELAKREAHLRRVINHQLGLVGVVDRNGHVLEVDDNSLRFAGCQRSEVLGRHFADCPWWTYDAAVADKLRESINRALRGEIVRYDVPLYAGGMGSPDARLMIDFMIAPVFDEQGNVEYLIPSGVDISERHAAEIKLRESQSKLQVLFDQSYFYMGIVDLNGVLIDINDAALSPYGFTRGQAIGKIFWDTPWWEGITDSRAKLQSAFNRALQGEKHYENLWFNGLEGEHRILGFAFTPAIDSDGHVAFVVATGSDVTDQVRRQEDLKLIADLQAEFSLHSSSEDIGRIGCQRIAEHLGLSRCAMREFSDDGQTSHIFFDFSPNQQPSIVGHYRTQYFLSDQELAKMRKGEPVVKDDTRDNNPSRGDAIRFADMNILAIVSAPFIGEGELRFSLSACKDQPYEWQPSEIALIKDLAALIYPRFERARSQEQLADSQARLEMAMQSAKIGSFDWNIETDVVVWDEQHLDLTGLPNRVSTGATFLQLVHPDDVAANQQAIERTFAGAPYDTEFRIIRPDGKTRWLAARGQVSLTADDDQRHFIGMNWDITEQKESAELIRLAEERLRSAAEAAGFGTIHTDLVDGTVSYSEQMKRLVGMDVHATCKLRPGEIADWVYPADRTACIEFYQELLSVPEGESRRLDHRIQLPGGEVRWVRMHAKPLYSGNNGDRCVTQLIGTMVDITQQRLFEESLEQARKQAEAANNSKSEFLANMSHEIRTPMTAIMGYTELVAEKTEDETILKHLQTIKRNSEFLLDIINDILDVSKIEAGKFEILTERFSPRAVVEDVRSIMEVRAIEKNLRLSVDYQGKLPAQIESDSKRLKQILINLVGNAIKFTLTGNVKIIVRHVVAAGRSMLQFDVVDSGIGISSEQQARLFQPFSQGDASVAREFGGTGLGLAISQRLARLLGGEISVRSELGQGSTFTATITTGDITGVAFVEPEISIEKAIAQVPTASIQLTCRILIVDDRRDIRFLGKHFLTQAGATVIDAEDGEQALQRVEHSFAQREPIDLILLDMQMPKLDGYATAVALRQLNFTGPIIALTADAMQGDMKRCIESGCNDYLSKPIDKQRLLEMVQRYLMKS